MSFYHFNQWLKQGFKQGSNFQMQMVSFVTL